MENASGNVADPRPPAVAVRGLTKRYGRVTALDKVDFTVARGEALALWGPNGAGKTTILRCLLGLARFSGEARVEGIDPARDGRRARRHVGYVPQQLPTPAMTVGELAAFVARLKGLDGQAIGEPLTRLGIGHLGDRPLAALSGGMKQRLGLALALVGAPTILLLDEPTANLDASGRSDLLQIVRELRAAGMALVFSSHRPEDVMALADRVLLLEAGRVRGTVSPAAFRERRREAARLVVTLRNGQRREAIATLAEMGLEANASDHVVRVAISPTGKAAAIAALVAAGIDIDDVELEGEAWTDRP
ncbi:MAG TPA: ABC transporter ATP-binding protein [Thermomicrobiales bacterium]|jgi:ABC-type multidrug transport system ATPase subunit|nr:ABC transporter ATP-binding protein [Thermomicrobiales bacterium]